MAKIFIVRTEDDDLPSFPHPERRVGEGVCRKEGEK
jgi:hypothetical protein